jgi:hypothetical protein
MLPVMNVTRDSGWRLRRASSRTAGSKVGLLFVAGEASSSHSREEHSPTSADQHAPVSTGVESERAETVHQQATGPFLFDWRDGIQCSSGLVTVRRAVKDGAFD